MKIKVIILEPAKRAIVKEIGNDLESMQRVVGGNIEVIYPFDDEVCLVCNEEGKITGLPLNRAVYNNIGNIMDIIVGTAFICDCSKEYFQSLRPQHMDKYLEKFQYPEAFVSVNGDIIAIPIIG